MVFINKKIANPAIHGVVLNSKEIEIIPNKSKYIDIGWKHVIDWNISRQLWWGHLHSSILLW